jgi:2-dehydro-3-deoxyphosphogluconate aldolase/(4S)-4-hydroxy-2-oxoglutarate aldolase
MSGVIEKIISAKVVLTAAPLSADILLEYTRVLHEEGWPVLEILARPDSAAFRALETISGKPERKLICLGIGTIKTAAQAREAAALRPDFIVSPAFSRRVLKVAVSAGIPYIPAVSTFQDTQDVLDAFEDEGLTLKVLKLCPVMTLTPDYLRCMGGCYPDITFCPTGKVTPENIGEWMSVPCAGPPMESGFVDRALLERRDFQGVRDSLRRLRGLVEKRRVTE